MLCKHFNGYYLSTYVNNKYYIFLLCRWQVIKGYLSCKMNNNMPTCVLASWSMGVLYLASVQVSVKSQISTWADRDHKCHTIITRQKRRCWSKEKATIHGLKSRYQYCYRPMVFSISIVNTWPDMSYYWVDIVWDTLIPDTIMPIYIRIRQYLKMWNKLNTAKTMH